jgi:hypothetical protein
MSGTDLMQGAERDVVFAEAARGEQYMARTHQYKLLLCRDPDDSQFFDLTQDPLETTNLMDEPFYQHLIAELRRRLLNWVLFDCPSRTHLDPDAPTIEANNVPTRKDMHVQQGRDYYRTQMTQPFEFHA